MKPETFEFGNFEGRPISPDAFSSALCYAIRKYELPVVSVKGLRTSFTTALLRCGVGKKDIALKPDPQGSPNGIWASVALKLWSWSGSASVLDAQKNTWTHTSATQASKRASGSDDFRAAVDVQVHESERRMRSMISLTTLAIGVLVAAVVAAEPLAELNTRGVHVQLAKSTDVGSASAIDLTLKSNEVGAKVFCLDILKDLRIDVFGATGLRVASKDIKSTLYLGFTNHILTKPVCASWAVGNSQTYELPIAKMFFFERAGEYVATIHIKPSSGFTSEELTLKPVIIQVTEAELSRR